MSRKSAVTCLLLAVCLVGAVYSKEGDPTTLSLTSLRSEPTPVGLAQAQKPQTGTQPTTLPIPGGWYNLNKTQYLSDIGFLLINKRLRKNEQLYHYNIKKVARQLVSGTNFNITYYHNSGIEVNFMIYLSLSL